MIIPIEMRGENRPVALYEELLNNYEVDFENIEMTKQMVAMKMFLE
jgi:glutaredoxin-related protein